MSIQRQTEHQQQIYLSNSHFYAISHSSLRSKQTGWVKSMENVVAHMTTTVVVNGDYMVTQVMVMVMPMPMLWWRRDDGEMLMMLMMMTMITIIRKGGEQERAKRRTRMRKMVCQPSNTDGTCGSSVEALPLWTFLYVLPLDLPSWDDAVLICLDMAVICRRVC